MDSKEYDRLCGVFLKTFASVPDSLRSQIIVVVDGKPFTWESSFVEVKVKTGKSKRIIEALKNLDVII